MIKIALTGNPNVGKTSLFNRITHSMEHVGNWHGVTVAKKEKVVMYDHRQIKISDLPGFYSLTVYSPEEAISRDAVLSGGEDLIVSVCEVGNLARNLYLTLQLLELDVPLVLAVNMMDELKKQGKVFNYRKLEAALKIPIVPMSAKYHSDVHLLTDVCLEHAKNPQNHVFLKYLDELPLDEVKNIIKDNAAAAGLKLRYAAIKVLENDSFVLEKLKLNQKQKAALDLLGQWQEKVAAARYSFIDEITEGAIIKAVVDEHHEMHEHTVHNVPLEECEQCSSPEPQEKTDKHKRHHDEHKKHRGFMSGVSKLDRVLLNKYLALPIFLLLMATIFVLTFGVIGMPLSSLLEKGIKKLIYNPAIKGLNKTKTPVWLQSLVGDGIIGGVGGILIFLPQIVLLFLFLAFLEDSGYISRVAFMTDGLFRKIGLSGRSVFTMLMGFGCSATAVLTARGLEDEKMRKKTVLLTPFMSCSARLPIYSAIAGSFFRFSPLVIFALYIIGAAVALFYAWLMQKITRLKSGKLSFIMEMPPYRVPSLERVLQLIWHNVKVFLIRVGTVIFALSVIVWVLSSFSLTHGFVANGQSKSIMQSLAGLIAPAFKPLGFGHWKAVTALLSGLVAKEAVVSSIDGLGGAEAVLGSSQLSAFCFLLFTLLYCPCIATLAAQRREVGAKWTLFGFVLQTGTAYIFALLVRGIGLLFISFAGVAITVLICVAVGLAVIFIILNMFKNKGRCHGCKSCDSFNEYSGGCSAGGSMGEACGEKCKDNCQNCGKDKPK